MACALIQKNHCQQLRGKSGKGQVFKSCFFSKSEWASKHWYWSLVRFFSMNLTKFTHIRCTWCTVCGSTRIRTRTQVHYNSRQHSAKGDAFMNILSPRPIWRHFLHFCYKEQWHCHDHSSQNAKPFSKQIRIKARLAQVVLRWSCWSIWREGPSPGMLFFFQNAFGQLRYWQMLKGKGKMICRRFWPSEPSFVEALALPFRYVDHHVAHRASEATWWKSEFRKAKFRIWIHWNTLNPFDIMWSERTSFWDVRQVVNAYIFKRSLGLHLFLRFCTPTAAFSWGSIQMCPTSLNNKPLVGSFVFVVFCFWHNLPHSTSFHRGWTPRLDGTLMIEHELIATWICCPQPVHSIDGSATMVLWGVAASNEFQVGRRPIFLRSKTLWWLEWSLEFETRSFSKWDRRQRVRCCPIIMTHNISWHLMIFTCNWRSQRLWLLYGELQWIFGFGWGAVLELQLCVEELC